MSALLTWPPLAFLSPTALQEALEDSGLRDSCRPGLHGTPGMLCHLVLRGCYSNQTIPRGRPRKGFPGWPAWGFSIEGADETALFTVGPAPCFLEQWLEMWILHMTRTKALKKTVKCIIQQSLVFLKNANSVIPCLTDKTSSKNNEGRLALAWLHLTPERAHLPLTCGLYLPLAECTSSGPRGAILLSIAKSSKTKGGSRTGVGILFFFFFCKGPVSQ